MDTEGAESLKFEGPTPRMLERGFRRHLGEVNPYLALADVSLVDLARTVEGEPNADENLAWRMRKAGHNRIYLKTPDIAKARRFVHLSAIAYVHSCGDFLCKSIQQHPEIAKARAAVAPSTEDEDEDEDKQKPKGWFLLRTLYLLLLTSRRTAPQNPPDPMEIEKVLDMHVYSLLDYFRIIRNFEFHGACGVAREASPIFEVLDHDRIKSEYGASLSRPGNIGRSDFVIYSKAWQRAAKSLCCAVAERKNVLPALIRDKYGSYTNVVRRRNGALAVLTQDFLLDAAAADAVIYDLGW